MSPTHKRTTHTRILALGLASVAAAALISGIAEAQKPST